MDVGDAQRSTHASPRAPATPTSQLRGPQRANETQEPSLKLYAWSLVSRTVFFYSGAPWFYLVVLPNSTTLRRHIWMHQMNIHLLRNFAHVRALLPPRASLQVLN